MTAKEAAHQAWRNLKGKPLKDKIEHIATYYWMPIAATLCVVAIVGSVIYSAATRKEIFLSGYCINANPMASAEALQQDFSQYAQVTEKQEVSFLSNLQLSDVTLMDSLQVLSLRYAAQEIDFLASDMETCQQLVRFGYYMDLSLLPAQQLALLSPYFLYAERALLKQDADAGDIKTPALGSKESFTDPVPVALRLPQGNRLSGAFAFTKDEAVLLLVPNSPRLDRLYVFLEYLLN